MATALTAAMTRLEILHLRLDSPRSRPDPESRLAPTHTLCLPYSHPTRIQRCLQVFGRPSGPNRCPSSLHLSVIFFMALDFDVPQLHRFIDHAEEFKTFDRADVSIFDHSIRLRLYPNTEEVDGRRQLELQINCRELDYQLSSLAQVCSPSFPLIFTLEELEIREHDSLSSSHWRDDMEGAQLLELLDPFTVLKDLYLTNGIAQHVCGALQELSGERTTAVSPALCNLFVRGSSLEPVQEAIESFVATRQLSGHPVVVDHWKD